MAGDVRLESFAREDSAGFDLIRGLEIVAKRTIQDLVEDWPPRRPGKRPDVGFRHSVLRHGMLLVMYLLFKDDWVVRRGSALPCMPVSCLHVVGPGL
jgi:hypothetical protein